VELYLHSPIRLHRVVLLFTPPLASPTITTTTTTSTTTAATTVTLTVGLAVSLWNARDDTVSYDTAYYDTVYYDTPSRNDSRLLERAYNSIRSFARAKVNNIGVG
jgi:hypothetical protein